MAWEVATPRNKRFKIFLEGPPGCFKTRTALRLANNGDFEDPAAAVIDTEFGTDHYAGDFAFRLKQTVDPDEIMNLVNGLIKNPGKVRTLIWDTFSVYYEALATKYVDLVPAARKELRRQQGGILHAAAPGLYPHQPRGWQGRQAPFEMRSERHLHLPSQRSVGRHESGWVDLRWLEAAAVLFRHPYRH